MSSHFTYEIDERKLRVRLKELEMPMDEEAWPGFENYVSLQNRDSGNNALGNFQLSLNRNIILPAVFGLLIIALSIILFRFININPGSSPEQKPQAEEMSVPASQNNVSQSEQNVGTSTGTVVSSATPEKNREAQNNVGATTTPTTAKNSLIPPTQSPTANSGGSVPTLSAVTEKPKPQPKPVATATNAIVQNTSQVSGTTTATEQPAKKKRKRRTAEEVESEPAAENRPSIETDERTTQDRPN